jgi:hypothetical protein
MIGHFASQTLSEGNLLKASRISQLAGFGPSVTFEPIWYSSSYRRLTHLSAVIPPKARFGGEKLAPINRALLIFLLTQALVDLALRSAKPPGSR